MPIAKSIKDWIIEPKLEAQATEFWQHIYGTHEEELAQSIECVVNPETPKSWKELSKESALKNLDHDYRKQNFAETLNSFEVLNNL